MTLDLEAIKRDLQPIERDDPTFSPHSDAHLWIGHTADLVAELERARAENAQAQAKLLEAKVGRMELAAENEGLMETLERARAVFKAVEWFDGREYGRFCEVCRGGHPEDWRPGDPGPKGPGHVPDCELAALLSAAPAPARSAPQ